MSSQKNTRSKLLFMATSIATTSIIGAIGYYYIQNYRIKNNYEKSLDKSFKLFFKTPKTKLINPTKEINQILRKFIQLIATNDKKKNILQLLPQQISNNQKYSQSPNCGVPILTGQMYFQCSDCSIMVENFNKKDEKLPAEYTYLTLCEDCFIPSQHEGHSYTKKDCQETSGTLICDCGDQTVCKKQAFCNKHQGVDFEQIKADYSDISEDFKQNLIEIFSIYLQKLILYTEELMSEGKEIFQDKKDHINILFNQIFNKIEELIKSNYIFSQLFVEFFQGKFENASFLHSCKNNSKLDLSGDDCEDECTCTRYKNLIRLSSLLTMENNTKIYDISKLLIQSSVEFKLFYTCESITIFSFLFISIEQELENGVKQPVLTPVPLIKIIAYTVCDEILCLKLFDILGNSILNPLKFFFHMLTTTSEFLLALHFELIEQVLNIAFEMYRYESLCLKFATLQENTQILLDMANHIEKLVPQGILNHEYYFQWSYHGVLVIMIGLLTETALRDFFCRMIRTLRKNDDQQLIQQFSDQCTSMIKRVYPIYQDDIKRYKSQKEQYIPCCGIFMTLPIDLIYLYLYELPTKENVKETLKKLFKFETDEQTSKFILQVVQYQTYHLLVNPNGYYYMLEVLDQQTAQDPDLNTVVKGVLSLLSEVQYLNYDSNLFVRQTMCLFEEETHVLRDYYLQPMLEYLSGNWHQSNDQYQIILQMVKLQILTSLLQDNTVYSHSYFYKTEELLKKQEDLDFIKEKTQQTFQDALITIMQNFNQPLMKEDIKKASKGLIHEFVDQEKILDVICDKDQTQKYTLKKEFQGQIYPSLQIRNYQQYVKGIMQIQKKEDCLIFQGSDTYLEHQLPDLKKAMHLMVIEPKIFKQIYQLYIDQQKLPHYLSTGGNLLHFVLDALYSYYVRKDKNLEKYDEQFKEMKNLFINEDKLLLISIQTALEPQKTKTITQTYLKYFEKIFDEIEQGYQNN